jgi:hypothetical protein
MSVLIEPLKVYRKEIILQLPRGKPDPGRAPLLGRREGYFILLLHSWR